MSELGDNLRQAGPPGNQAPGIGFQDSSTVDYSNYGLGVAMPTYFFHL